MNTLRALLSTTQDLEAFLEHSLEFKRVSICALEQVLARARAVAEDLEAELAEKRQIIAETQVALAAEAAAAEPKKEARVWRVSDCHSHRPSGAWPLEATESGTYGIGVHPSENPSCNMPITLRNGKQALVSKKRYNEAKEISVGDTLYMGDKKRGIVFKGLVTGQSVKGLFLASDPSVNSFRRRVAERVKAAGLSASTEQPAESDVEIMWEVDWTPVGALTPEWKKYLHFSERRTVVPLSGSAPEY